MTKVLLLGVAALLEPSPVTVLDEMIGEGLITSRERSVLHDGAPVFSREN